MLGRASYGTDFKVFLLPAGTVNAAPQATGTSSFALRFSSVSSI